MEHNVRVLPPEVLMEDLLALLEQTQPIPLRISGNSMYPFLADGRDTVFLARVDRPVKRGDILLYRRSSGQYVLHRVAQIREDSLVMLGDGQVTPEPGIRHSQVLAMACAVRRKGKLLEPGSITWKFFETIWARSLPVRPWLLALCRKLSGSPEKN